MVYTLLWKGAGFSRRIKGMTTTLIRSREDALSALSDVLNLPTRIEQIIQITVHVAVCLDTDAREFLADCQAGLLSGGLEAMRTKRRELLEQLDSEDLVVILDPEEDRLFDEIATALDALKLSGVVREVFPELTTRLQRWEVARAMLVREAAIQERVVAALKSRSSDPNGQTRSHLCQETLALIAQDRPVWYEKAEALRSEVHAALNHLRMGGGIDPTSEEMEEVFEVIAAREGRAQELWTLSKRDPAGAIAFVGKVCELIFVLRQMLSQEQEPVKVG